MVRLLLSLVMLAAVSGAAMAQRLPDLPGEGGAPARPSLPAAALAERAAGVYRLSDPKGDVACAVTFATAKGKGGMVLTFEPACSRLFPLVQGVAGWSPSPRGGLQWRDEGGAVMLEFNETETGVFEAFATGERSVLFLNHAALSAATLPSPQDVAGGWVLTRAGQKALCRIKLDDAVLGGGQQVLEDRLVLKAGECDRGFAALGLFAWRIERELLVLYGKDDQVLTFRADGSGPNWQKIPAERPAVVLQKP